MSSRRRQLPVEPVEAEIETLSHEGRGIARVEGKTVFVDGALAGERVRFRYTSRRSRFDEAELVELLTASPDRVEPHCTRYAVCGGCALQHMSSQAQLGHKQHVLLEQFRHVGGVMPETILPPLTGPVYGYRHKARLGVRYVRKKDTTLVGFRERRKPYIADIDTCPVLHPAVGEQIDALKRLIDGLSVREQIPQIEVAVGDDVVVLVIRHMAPLSAGDREALVNWSRDSGIRLLLQPGDRQSVVPLIAGQPDTQLYRLDDYNLAMSFSALDFTQVNFRMNVQMIARALDLLSPADTDEVLDLFCGLGNFTLPIATRVGTVTGVEGEAALVRAAERNAEANGLTNVSFQVADLYGQPVSGAFLGRRWNKILMDPPRSGAREIIEQMSMRDVQRVVYVSCNPATLARDAGLLVARHGFRLASAGIMDMFPHTTHVESIALFERS